MQTALH